MRTPVLAVLGALGALAAVVAVLARPRRATPPPQRTLRVLPGGHRCTARRLRRSDVVVITGPGGQAPRRCG
ncbi:hypothetical protein [Saccharopolyspora hordei]|uniref:Uncharacterized protein n=1 Tax=Saccharopolyspora hordei TaxID=1838 RepID=A0A853AP60_9PSEU|nr:hypothetical protein [Saccharopolyspora hordei]NYI81927.1 hypothetical protein [Saccharopolyspora hordei]